MTTIDSHFHIWDPGSRDHSWLDAAPFPALRRAYLIEEYAQLAATNAITGGVLVQVLNDLDETLEFLRIGARQQAVLGVVGWVDLEAPDVADLIAQLREAPGGELLVGIRHLVQAEPDPNYLERGSVSRGLSAVADAGLVFDLLVSEMQLASALRGIERVEHLNVVLDHGGKPGISAGPGQSWGSLMSEFAATGRVACKLSGFVTEAGPGWVHAQLRPFLDRVVEAFGPKQVMFGSDWPVLNAVASYDQVLGLVESTIAWLDGAERQAIMGGNAKRVYGLNSCA